MFKFSEEQLVRFSDPRRKNIHFTLTQTREKQQIVFIWKGHHFFCFHFCTTCVLDWLCRWGWLLPHFTCLVQWKGNLLCSTFWFDSLAVTSLVSRHCSQTFGLWVPAYSSWAQTRLQTQKQPHSHHCAEVDVQETFTYLPKYLSRSLMYSEACPLWIFPTVLSKL